MVCRGFLSQDCLRLHQLKPLPAGVLKRLESTSQPPQTSDLPVTDPARAMNPPIMRQLAKAPIPTADTTHTIATQRPASLTIHRSTFRPRTFRR